MFRAPGFVVSQEQTVAATLVLNTMFIFSVFVFATLIGLVGDEVKQSVSSSGSSSRACKPCTRWPKQLQTLVLQGQQPQQQIESTVVDGWHHWPATAQQVVHMPFAAAKLSQR
jgi:hypothetical protein